ncbi:hypothetical protein EJ03DRAFT_350377 [Teratosphaeria nubilosa]|uniref:N-acetyltransferase domain-containing protein n=1 Tax=Teratosphaeria nubilosa TaxID=161662 RepID=A0A6G1LC77_9PEZI|nr:hypothetical protein EJ03DRAFT_350377 [Teratosphaeria nubilosa]
MHLKLFNSPCADPACNDHTNIQALSGHLLIDNIIAGSLKAQLLFAARMRTQDGLIQMWQECQEFDACSNGAKIEKVENYLANESFAMKDRQRDVDEASVILHVEEVWLKRLYRGEGRGLWMVRELVRQLELADDVVVMLQAGPLSRERQGQDTVESDGKSAHERIACHWKKLGFDEWSDSDDAWLCLRVGEMKQSAGRRVQDEE